MAEVPLGDHGEVVLYGLPEAGLEDVQQQLGAKGLDLVGANLGLVQEIATIRGLALTPHRIAERAEWLVWVAGLTDAVEYAERRIKQADLSDYALKRMGVVLPNPAYTQERVLVGDEDQRTVSTRYQAGVRKYNYLTPEALSNYSHPTLWAQRGDLQNLAVAVLMDEPLD